MEQKGFKITDLILSLNNVDTDNSTIFSTDAAFTKISNINELFFWIGQYCDIFNYELLIELLTSIECKEALELLEGFTKELHLSVLLELDLLSEAGELQDPIPRNHKLVVKYTGAKCLVKTEGLIRSIICEFFNLKPWSFTLNCVQDGCIALVYQISSTVKSHLLQYKTTTNHVALLKKNHIKSIIIDGEVLKIPSGLTEKMPLFVLISGKV